MVNAITLNFIVIKKRAEKYKRKGKCVDEDKRCKKSLWVAQLANLKTKLRAALHLDYLYARTKREISAYYTQPAN